MVSPVFTPHIKERPHLDEETEHLFTLVGFEPREDQVPILACEKRNELLAGGGQSGKSLLTSKKFLKEVFEDNAKRQDMGLRNWLLYWLVAADYERTRAEFNYIAEDLGKIFGVNNVHVTKRIDPGMIQLKFSDGISLTIETKSAKDPRTLAMYAPDGIMVCEASQVDYEVYMRCQERVGPVRGWVFMSGTFEGSLGWYPKLWEAWRGGYGENQSFSMDTRDNFYLYPGGKNDPEIQRIRNESTEEFFNERILGVPMPPKGLVIREFRPDLHIRDVEWVPGVPVHLWEDPGYGESAHAVLMCQVIDGQVRVFDEVHEHGLLTRDIINMVMENPARPWAKDVKFLVSDPHYKDQHHAMTSVAEQWLKQVHLYAGGEKIRINEGTERFRQFLKPDPLTGEPRIVFNPRCRGTLSELGAMPNPHDGLTKVYRWKTDREGNVVGDTPNDRHNDGIKAAIYGLVATFGYGLVGKHDKMKVKRF